MTYTIIWIESVVGTEMKNISKCLKKEKKCVCVCVCECVCVREREREIDRERKE